MNKIILVLSLCFCFASNSFAEGCAEGDKSCLTDSGGAGTNVLGINCPACRAMEKAGQTQLLGDTGSIFRPTANNGQPKDNNGNSLPAIDPVNIGR